MASDRKIMEEVRRMKIPGFLTFIPTEDVGSLEEDPQQTIVKGRSHPKPAPPEFKIDTADARADYLFPATPPTVEPPYNGQDFFEVPRPSHPGADRPHTTFSGLKGYLEQFPENETVVSKLPEAIRESKWGWLNSITIAAQFTDEVEDGDMVEPVLPGLPEDVENLKPGHFPELAHTKWQPTFPKGVPANELSAECAQPEIWGIAYKTVGRVIFGPCVIHPRFTWPTGTKVYAQGAGDLGPTVTGVQVGIILGPGKLFLYNSTQQWLHHLEKALQDSYDWLKDLEGITSLIDGWVQTHEDLIDGLDDWNDWTQYFQLDDHEEWLKRLTTWITNHQNWLENHQRWLETHEKWLECHEAWLKDHQTWLESHEKWLIKHEEWLVDHEQRIIALEECCKRHDDEIKELQECCEENRQCCSELRECCDSHTDDIKELQECCEENKQCCSELRECCEESRECCAELRECCQQHDDDIKELQECCEENRKCCENMPDAFDPSDIWNEITWIKNNCCDSSSTAEGTIKLTGCVTGQGTFANGVANIATTCNFELDSPTANCSKWVGDGQRITTTIQGVVAEHFHYYDYTPTQPGWISVYQYEGVALLNMSSSPTMSSNAVTPGSSGTGCMVTMPVNAGDTIRICWWKSFSAPERCAFYPLKCLPVGSGSGGGDCDCDYDDSELRTLITNLTTKVTYIENNYCSDKNCGGTGTGTGTGGGDCTTCVGVGTITLSGCVNGSGTADSSGNVTINTTGCSTGGSSYDDSELRTLITNLTTRVTTIENTYCSDKNCGGSSSSGGVEAFGFIRKGSCIVPRTGKIVKGVVSTDGLGRSYLKRYGPSANYLISFTQQNETWTGSISVTAGEILAFQVETYAEDDADGTLILYYG